MRPNKEFCIGFLILALPLYACSAPSDVFPSPEEVTGTIELVNNFWQTHHPEYGNAFWDQAAYHTGNMAAYEVTGDTSYLAYSMGWAIKNQWEGARSDQKKKWKYSYGETDDYVLFGDWQICFQTYIDLYNLSEKKDSSWITRALEVMGYEVSTKQLDYWWWADGLYMVMPVMTRMYHLTGNTVYLEKLYQYFKYAQGIMYDEETGLFYRDARYVYPVHKTRRGLKDFWARGNGWVLAGLARVLQDLPETWEQRGEFESIFKKMAYTLKDVQQPDGYWTRSILDPDQAPGPETSGTAFFTFGMLWGMNNGLLDEKEFQPTVVKCWQYLKETAINPSGRVGYIQPIGERAIPGQVVNEKSTANFGVGAVLLAASEMYKYVSRDDP